MSSGVDRKHFASEDVFQVLRNFYSQLYFFTYLFTHLINLGSMVLKSHHLLFQTLLIYNSPMYFM